MAKQKKVLDLSIRENRIKFRSSVAWKRFRESIIATQGPVCSLCGTKYTGKQKRMLQLHHLDPANYDDLDPVKFRLVCGSCHDTIERFVIKLKGSKRDSILNKEKWLNLLSDHLPYFVILLCKDNTNES